MSALLAPTTYKTKYSPTFAGGILFAQEWLKSLGWHDEAASLYTAYHAAEVARQAEIRRLAEAHELPEFSVVGYPEVPK